MSTTLSDIDQKISAAETRCNMLAPKLRFREFDGVWENRKLEEVVKIGRGKSKHRPRNARFLYGGNYPFIQTGDIKSAEMYLTKYTQTYSEEGLKQSKLWDENTLCITIAANIAETAILKIKACFPDSIIGLLPKGNQTIVLFVKYLFDKFKIEIQNLSQGVAQDNLNQEKLSNIEFKFPTLPEQQKIASFLSAVDEKVQQLTRKKELLEQYKKGVMQQLFSGELRFKDEKGMDFPDWEKKRLGDVGDIVTGKTPNTSDLNLWNGDIQFVTPTDINNNKYQFKTQRTIKELTSTRLLPSKSIMFTCIASIGKMSMSIKPCITNQQINSIVPFKDFDNEFIYYSVLNIADFIKSTQSTTTLPIINKTEFSKFKISVPTSYQEQQKIATYLSSIDTKIESVTKQITQTQRFKKGLLQQMFV